MDKMDLVYLVRPGDLNDDLRISLRSVEKFAAAFRNIVIVGFKPCWVSDKVIYIPTEQPQGGLSKHNNTNNNLLAACNDPRVSDNFILMNDDFIFLKQITDWHKSLDKVKNTIQEQIKKSTMCGISAFADCFRSCLPLIQKMSGKAEPYNYELHMPLIINKANFIELFSRPEVQAYIQEHTMILKRSLYGNCFIDFNEAIYDVKIRDGDPDNFETEIISVPDGYIGNNNYPRFNKFLNDLFPTKSIYET